MRFLAKLLLLAVLLAPSPADSQFAGTSGGRVGTSSETLTSSISDYPFGATPITGNATGTTGAVVGTLAGAASKTTFICGFDVSAVGGTAAVGPITVAGVKTASM